MIRRSLTVISFVFLIVFNEILCLKIKIESVDILKITSKDKATRMISHLLINGPYNLLAELLGLETIDFKSIGSNKCLFLKSDIVLNIIQDFESGELTFEQFRRILSAECAGKLSKKTFDELIEIGAFKKLPSNLLEYPELQTHKLQADTFMTLLNEAVHSENREMIYWNRWNGGMVTPQVNKIYKHRMWTENKYLWQTINFRNLALIKESEIMLRFHLIDFIGFITPSTELDELVQRCYMILSFIKVAEMDYQQHIINNSGINNIGADNSDSLLEGILQNMISANIKVFVRLNTRINQLNTEEERKLKSVFDFCMLEIEQQAGKIDKVNEIFANFLQATKSIQVGDWLLTILFILVEHLQLVSIDNISEFLAMFFEARPSICSVNFVYSILKDKLRNSYRIDDIFMKHFIEKPIYLEEMYKGNRALLPTKLVHMLPLRMRFIENLKKRMHIYPGTRQIFLEFKTIKNPVMSSLRKMLEIVEVIGWNRLSVNQQILVVDIDDVAKLFPFNDLVKLYFELFLSQDLFYEIQSFDSEDGRPIIRILPAFPVEMWHQISHLMTRAVLLNIRIPFILCPIFFKSVKENELRLLSEMSLKIDMQSDENLRQFYSFIRQDIDLNPVILHDKLIQLCLKIEEFKTSRNPRGILATRSFELESQPQQKTMTQRRLLRRHSIKELSEILKASKRTSITTFDLLVVGLNSFEKGLSSGMNINDFTIEEVYKIIFYSGKR